MGQEGTAMSTPKVKIISHFIFACACAYTWRRKSQGCPRVWGKGWSEERAEKTKVTGSVSFFFLESNAVIKLYAYSPSLFLFS
jgi:hypothetical protein